MPRYYCICAHRDLDPTWSYWFDGMAIRHNADSTATLVGSVVDQAAWYGLIGKARDLGLTLLAVTRCEEADDQRRP